MLVISETVYESDAVCAYGLVCMLAIFAAGALLRMILFLLLPHVGTVQILLGIGSTVLGDHLILTLASPGKLQ